MRQNKTKFVEIRAEWKKPDTFKNDSEEKSSDKSFNFEEAEKTCFGQRCSTTTTTTMPATTTPVTFYGHNYPILFKKQIESIEAPKIDEYYDFKNTDGNNSGSVFEF